VPADASTDVAPLRVKQHKKKAAKAEAKVTTDAVPAAVSSVVPSSAAAGQAPARASASVPKAAAGRGGNGGGDVAVDKQKLLEQFLASVTGPPLSAQHLLGKLTKPLLLDSARAKSRSREQRRRHRNTLLGIKRGSKCEGAPLCTARHAVASLSWDDLQPMRSAWSSYARERAAAVALNRVPASEDDHVRAASMLSAMDLHGCPVRGECLTLTCGAVTPPSHVVLTSRRRRCLGESSSS
jgi:hypothetical protein